MASSRDVYDVIVIGAGIEGSSCAYNLVKEGKKVLLLEQFPLPHSRGSSHGQSRITRYAYTDTFYVRMMVDAFPMWAQLEREAGERIFLNCGILDLRSNAESANKVISALSALNIPYEVLLGPAIRQRFPAFTVLDTDHGVFDPSGGLIFADKALAAFQRVFKRLGGTIHDNEPVLSIKPGSPAKVLTSRSEYVASSVVIAAGPWTGNFTSALGLTLPLVPTRVTPMYWRVKPGQAAIHHWTRLPGFIDSRWDENHGFHFYGLPSAEYPDLVKVANHNGVPCNPDKRDLTEEDGSWIQDQNRQCVQSTFKGLETEPAIQESCMYTVTPDNHPFIDRHPKYQNIVIAGGFCGSGFKLAPAVGKAVVELLTGRASNYDMKPFRIGRFQTKAKL